MRKRSVEAEAWRELPKGGGVDRPPGGAHRPLALGFHLNNQLTQALTSRYRDSRLRVDFERFVSCAAQLTCIFRECCLWGTVGWDGRTPTRLGGVGVAQPARSVQATAAGTWMEARGSSA